MSKLERMSDDEKLEMFLSLQHEQIVDSDALPKKSFMLYRRRPPKRSSREQRLTDNRLLNNVRALGNAKITKQESGKFLVQCTSSLVT